MDAAERKRWRDFVVFVVVVLGVTGALHVLRVWLGAHVSAWR